ncbi:MAG: histidinol dehydrogenase [Anaeroplasmataceae bacterium]
MIKILKTNEEITDFLNVLDERGQVDNGVYLDTVMEILADVKKNKDEAVLKYTQKFDDKNASLENLVVSNEELKNAYESLDEKMKDVLNTSKERVEAYHKLQLRETWINEAIPGEKLGQKITPIAKAGVYVPGGKAAYPSSVIMNVMPAYVAGVEEIIMVTPAVNGQIKQTVLAAAYICGVTKVIKIGGAQAIAALAYGTNIVPKVDKIVGPGNIFVALAKRMVFGTVGIDSIAGPSEILVLANETANPKFLAADLLAQAEHDELASGILVTTSEDIALSVQQEVENYYNNSIRQNILTKSIDSYSRIIIVNDMKEACKLANIIAPEHLEICVDNPFDYLDDIKNAGAIFLGHYTPEALGDYMAGPNHVLPTVKTSRFFSPLGVDDFIKKSSILNFTKEALDRYSDKVIAFANEEGLQMHGESVNVRK